MLTSLKKGLSVICIVLLAYSISCVDPIDIVNDTESGSLVVDGLITDDPGPYKVTLTRSRTIGSDLDNSVFVQGAVVLLQDDAGQVDTLTEQQPGQYFTDSTRVRGVQGKKYRIHIKTRERHVYQSDYQEILPVGTIDSVYYLLKRRTFTNEYGAEEPRYDFDLYANATFPAANGSFAVWRWTGVYEVNTYPRLRTKVSRNDPDFDGMTVTLPDPPKCSGYIFLRDLYLQRRMDYYILSSECTCCRCWVSQPSTNPVLTENAFNATRFFDVALGSVSAQDDEPFRYKYRVNIELMSVDENLFKYWDNIATQRANDIFIPPTGKLRGNIIAIDQAPEAFGVFRASSVSRKSIDIPSRSLPRGLTAPMDSVLNDCRTLKNSTNRKPPGWD